MAILKAPAVAAAPTFTTRRQSGVLLLLLCAATAVLLHTAGTSFAAPYTAGVIALWLQQRQQQAAEAGVALDAGAVSHDAVLRGLVSTARGVPDRDNKDFLESVALMGAGAWGFVEGLGGSCMLGAVGHWIEQQQQGQQSVACQLSPQPVFGLSMM